MIKSLLVLVLAAALAGGMFISKPSPGSFTDFMKTQNQPAQAQTLSDMGKTILGGLIGGAKAAVLTYDDHIFWATEDQNGQPQYVGMFGHWWKKGAATATPAATPSAS